MPTSSPHPFGLSAVSPVCSGGSGVPVSSSLLRPVHNPTGLFQGLLSDIRMGASARHVPPPVSGRLTGCSGVSASFPSSSQSSAPVMPGHGHCYKLGKVGPTTFHLSLVSWHDHRHLLGEGVPSGCLSLAFKT